MRTLLISVCLILFSSVSNAALEDGIEQSIVSDAVEFSTTPAVFAGCTALDLATTVYAVSNGIAYEANPVYAATVNAHNFIPLIVSKLLLAGLIWVIYDHYKQMQAAKLGVAAMSAITCGVAAHNLLVITQ